MKGETQAKGSQALAKETKKRQARELQKTAQIDKRLAQKYLDIASVMFVVIDTDMKVIMVNRKTCDVLGYTENEIIGRNWFDNFIPESLRTEIKKTFKKIINKKIKTVEYYENPVLTKDGQEKIIAWHNSFMTNKSGDITISISSGEDITERRKIEEALCQSEKSLLKSQHVAHLGFWNWDIKQNIFSFSDETYRIFGILPHSIKATYEAFFSFVHPEDREFVQRSISLSMRTGKTKPIVYRILLPNGSVRFVQEQSEVNFDEKGKPAQMIGTIQDITERKEMEDALRASEERFRATFEKGQLGMIIADLDHKWLQVNNRMCQMLGYKESELIGQYFSDFTHPAYLEKDNIGLKALAKGKIPYHKTEKRYIRKNGDTLWASTTVSLIKDKGGNPIHHLAMVEDISERKKAEKTIKESEENFRNSLDNSPVGIAILNKNGSFAYANKALVEVYGFKDFQELKSTPRNKRYTPKTNAEHLERMRQIREGKSIPKTYELDIIRKDGEIRHLLASHESVLWNGKTKLQITYQDISKKLALGNIVNDMTANFVGVIDFDKVLNATLASIGKFSKASHVAVFLADKNKKIAHPTYTWYASNVKPMPALLTNLHITNKNNRLLNRLRQGELINTPDISKLKHRAYGNDPSLEKICKLVGIRSQASAPIFIGDQLTGIIGIASTEGPKEWEEDDLTILQVAAKAIGNTMERRKAEEQIKHAAEEWRTTFDSISDFVSIHDSEYRFLRVNRALARTFKMKPEEIIGKTCYEIVHGLSKPPPYCPKLKMRKSTKPAAAEYYEARAGIYLHETSWPLLNEKGEITASVHVARDITASKIAQEVLRRSEEKLRRIFSSVGDGVVATDLNGIITEANERALEIMGVTSKEKLVGRSLFDFIIPEEREKATVHTQKTLEQGVIRGLEYTFIRADGSTFPGEMNTSVLKDITEGPAGFIGIIRDTTERKNMQGQLIITDRLASVGELAAGVAHELNNPLTGVIGFSQLLLDREIPDDIRGDVEIIYREAQRSSEVVKNLLAFARKHAPAKQLANLNEIVDKVLQLRAYEQKVNNIQVETRYDPELPRIMGDPFQLQQVFLNIILNAEHAMTDTNKEGTLIITTEVKDKNAIVSFADNGPGIRKEAISHLFDPFFTTKEVGKGTGLGLSICHGIVTEHNGRIYAENNAGKGATFVVELPIIKDENGAVK